MFGSDIIRIKVKGYLRNITDNEIDRRDNDRYARH